jgi:ABC-2 type transport system ATP-binding protein
MNQEIVIKTDKLTKTFGDFTAVDSISFDVYKGEIFGFLGANGAGKTTAMRMLTGLSQPTSGKAIVAGYDVYTQAEEIKNNIGKCLRILNFMVAYMVWRGMRLSKRLKYY